MNQVCLIGRITRDPEVKYSTSGTAFCRFTIGINRGKDKDGKDRGADFPPIVVFGRQAENMEKYVAKGRLLGISGHIQTGSYEDKDGRKVYTTEVIADRIEYLEWGDRQEGTPKGSAADVAKDIRDNGIPEGFQNITDDDIPF